MSHTKEQLQTIEDARADFESFVAKGFLSDARRIVDNLGELGYETEAMFLHRRLNLIESLDSVEDVDPNTEEPGGDVRDYLDEEGR